MNFLDPHSVASHFGIGEGMHVAELHSGSGFFTPLLSKHVGAYGKVFAIHPSKEIIFKHSNVHQIQADIAKEETVELPEKMDVVLSNCLLSNAEPHIAFSILSQSYRLLKSGGKLIVIEWLKEEGEKSVEEETIHLAGLSGFTKEKRFHAGDLHIGLVFKKG